MTTLRTGVLPRFGGWAAARSIAPTTGGFSSGGVWRLETVRGALALRRWPDETPHSKLARIHRVVQHAVGGQGCRLLSAPLATDEGQTIVEYGGALWDLSPWIPGEASFAASPTVQRACAAAAALAEVHRALATWPEKPREVGFAPAVAERIVRLERLLAGEREELLRRPCPAPWEELDTLRQRWRRRFDAAADETLAQLREAATWPTPLQMSLRDVWREHLLFASPESEQVTGLIDLSAMRHDTPATDLARLLRSLVGVMPPQSSILPPQVMQAALEAYAAVATLSAREVELVARIDAANQLLAPATWLRWILVEDRQFDPPRVLARLHELLD